MEINRALPAEVERCISNNALRQALAYTKAPPTCYSYKTSCCGVYRQNSNLVDPGYYLNGGPSCQQQGVTCDTPHEHEIEAIADGLVPGSFVYAPKSTDQFWPAIVDFCPHDESHFVIFKLGGPHCCAPYAYYLSFIPDCTGEVYGGWYTTDCIVPFDTAVHVPIRMSVNFNDPHFDSAYERANKYYPQDIKSRLDRFSIVCRTLSSQSRRVRKLKSPTKSIKGKVTTQALKISFGLVKRLGPDSYARYEGGENVSLASSSASSSTSTAEASSSGFTGMLFRKLSLKSPSMPRAIPERDSEFGILRFSDLTHGRDHVHPIKQASPIKELDGAAAESVFVNNTQHTKTAAHEIYKRSAIQAIVKCDVHEIRVRKVDGNA